MKKKEIEQLIDSRFEDMMDHISDIFGDKAKKQEPKFEVGKWYWTDTKNLLFLEERAKLAEDGNGDRAYGLNYLGTWLNSEMRCLDNIEREATKEEVEEALIKEAKRRGFKEGVKFNALSRHGDMYYQYRTLKEINGFDADGELCANNWGLRIFANGKWAEIIKGVEINGYQMEIERDIVKFGCAKFTIGELKGLEKNISSFNLNLNSDPKFRSITSIKLNSGVEITVEQLKEICKELN